MSASGVTVAAEHLTKRYGALAAVDDLTFEVPAGQLVAVLGPNGAGKTTTLEMLEGFVAPTSGAARVLGADPRRGGRAWRARIGLVLQSTSLEAELTVRETLALYARPYPAPRPVGEVMNLAGLTDDARTRVGVLSGGQRRRVDLAIGIIGQPEVLFLDERWRATPLPRWCYFLGRIVACVIVAAIAGVATVLAAVLLYHTHLSSFAWLGALAAFILGGAAWAAALSAAIPTTEAAAPTLMLIYFPAIIISGVVGSISEPRWLYTLATYLPAQPLISAVTSALSHPPGTPLLPVRDVVVLAAWAVAGLVTAVAVFRWEPHRPAGRRSPRR